MLRPAAALLLAAVAAAQESDSKGVRGTDASIADAARWVGPLGSASGNLASRAMPVVSEVEEAWRLDFEAVEAPPVHWDGTGYAVVRAGGKPHLVAFAMTTGREIARTPLRAFDPRGGLLVWNHLVYLQPDEQQISAYRLSGRTFEMGFSLRGRTIDGELCYPRMPVVHDNEIYVVLGRYVARYVPGPSFPMWESRLETVWGEKIHAGRPCVRGPHVFVPHFVVSEREVAGRTLSSAYLCVAVFRRSDGRRVLSQRIAAVPLGGTGDAKLEAVIAGSRLYLRSPWLRQVATRTATTGVQRLFGPNGGFVDIEASEDARSSVRLGTAYSWDADTLPAYHPSKGAIALSSASSNFEWLIHRGDRVYHFASQEEQPDLFADRVAPTVLGDIVYFGSWAADIQTGEILWRLPVSNVTFPAVPAHRLVVVVEDGRSLRAFRGRGVR